MEVFIGADHGGFCLKEQILGWLEEQSFSVEDMGTSSAVSCDYPLFAKAVAKQVQRDSNHRGVLICTSGVGMAVTANKFQGCYAACLTTQEAVIKARQHNGINILCLPGNLSLEAVIPLLKAFLNTELDQGERHVRRRSLIQAIERENFVELS